MNFTYQLARHFACHMARWSGSDPVEVRAEISARIKAGQSWLWPEPKQRELFA